MVRLIASDLDGTLLQNGTKEISKEAVYYIKKLYEYGVCLRLPAADNIQISGDFFQRWKMRLPISARMVRW